MGTRSHCSPQPTKCVVNQGFRHALGPPPAPTARRPHPFRGPNRARLSVSLDPHFFSDACRRPLTPKKKSKINWEIADFWPPAREVANIFGYAAPIAEIGRIGTILLGRSSRSSRSVASLVIGRDAALHFVRLSR